MSHTLILPRTLVLVGLMGAGKTSIGRRLARELDLPFVDADAEIEAAASATITEIFEQRGEAEFRAGERRVIARLLQGPVQVLATGGGAFIDPSTRTQIREHGISVWLRVDLDTLVERVSRRRTRPLLNQGDPREILAKFMELRHPIYAEADITVDAVPGPPEKTVQAVIDAVTRHLAANEPPGEGQAPESVVQ